MSSRTNVAFVNSGLSHMNALLQTPAQSTLAIFKRNDLLAPLKAYFELKKRSDLNWWSGLDDAEKEQSVVRGDWRWLPREGSPKRYQAFDASGLLYEKWTLEDDNLSDLVIHLWEDLYDPQLQTIDCWVLDCEDGLIPAIVLSCKNGNSCETFRRRLGEHGRVREAGLDVVSTHRGQVGPAADADETIHSQSSSNVRVLQLLNSQSRTRPSTASRNSSLLSMEGSIFSRASLKSTRTSITSPAASVISSTESYSTSLRVHIYETKATIPSSASVLGGIICVNGEPFWLSTAHGLQNKPLWSLEKGEFYGSAQAKLSTNSKVIVGFFAQKSSEGEINADLDSDWALLRPNGVSWRQNRAHYKGKPLVISSTRALSQCNETLLIKDSNEIMSIRCSRSATLLTLPGSMKMQRVHRTTGPISVGDSGCWIIDAMSGDLVGILVMLDHEDQTGFMLPITTVFNSIAITRSLDLDSIALTWTKPKSHIAISQMSTATIDSNVAQPALEGLDILGSSKIDEDIGSDDSCEDEISQDIFTKEQVLLWIARCEPDIQTENITTSRSGAEAAKTPFQVLTPLSQRFASIPPHQYRDHATFITKYPTVLEEESSEFVEEAIRLLMMKENNLANACINCAIIIRSCGYIKTFEQKLQHIQGLAEDISNAEAYAGYKKELLTMCADHAMARLDTHEQSAYRDRRLSEIIPQLSRIFDNIEADIQKHVPLKASRQVRDSATGSRDAHRYSSHTGGKVFGHNVDSIRKPDHIGADNTGLEIITATTELHSQLEKEDDSISRLSSSSRFSQVETEPTVENVPTETKRYQPNIRAQGQTDRKPQDVQDENPFRFLNPLSQRFALIHPNRFDQYASFIEIHPDVLSENSADFIQEAIRLLTIDEKNLALNCIHCGLLIYNCQDSRKRKMKWRYLQRLEGKNSDAEEFDKQKKGVLDACINKAYTMIGEPKSRQSSINDRLLQPEETVESSGHELEHLTHSVGDVAEIIVANLHAVAIDSLYRDLGLNERVKTSFAWYSQQNGKFFSPGTVFSFLWHKVPSEPNAGLTIDELDKLYWPQEQPIVTKGPRGEKIFAQTRRMVVIKNRNGYCWCVGINTYGGQGLTKPGLSRALSHAHAIIHDKDKPPKRVKGRKRPIAVKMSKGYSFHPASCINFSQPIYVECNVKVASVGQVVSDSMAPLIKYTKIEIFGKS